MVVAPANYNEMKEQTAIFICVTNIFVGKSSLLSLALKDFYGHLIRYSSELKHRIKSDDLLPAKILFAVDEEIQRWLKKNRITTPREEVNNSLLDNFTAVIDDALRVRFNIILPSVFKMDDRKSNDSDLPAGPVSRKRKGIDDKN